MKGISFFIVLEGIDGSGTTTHSQLLSGFLQHKKFKVHLTHEPSKSEIGLLLRKVLKDKNIHPSTDSLLFAADRSYHYFNEIKQKLEEGNIVISDRYLESSIVYQSTQSDQITVKWLQEINKFIGHPDLTILLDIDPMLSLARKMQQNQQPIEKFEDISFLHRVRELYVKRAIENAYPIINTDDIIEIVQERIQNLVIEQLNKKCKQYS